MREPLVVRKPYQRAKRRKGEAERLDLELPKERGPNRPLVERLSTLKGWLPRLEVEETKVISTQSEPAPWYDPEGPPRLVEYFVVQPTWREGWQLLTAKHLQDHKDDPKWTWAKVPKSTISTRHHGYTLWVGQCSTCRKFTVSTSTFFLKGVQCAHCVPPNPKRSGSNLYIGGKLPSDGTHLLRAKNLETAQAEGKAAGLAWVAPAYAGYGVRHITHPVMNTKPERPPNTWAFPVGDVPPRSDYDSRPWEQAQPEAYWEGTDGQTFSWYVCPVMTDIGPEPEPYDEPQEDPQDAPPLNEAGHVAFDDFF